MSTASVPTDSNPIIFYDIATRPPVEKNAYAPNPWKARQTLNFKKLPYTTKWVALPDITKVRSSLHVPPCRKFADGSDFFTLPIIHDPATDSLVGDSFDIAVYLNTTYPPATDTEDLFPAQTLDFSYDIAVLVPLSDYKDKPFPEYARFNAAVDAAFSTHVLLTVQNLPFEPSTADEAKAEFVRRAGASKWEDFALEGEAREKTKESLRGMLGELGKLFERDASGPFVLGARPSYADFIVGAWLHMLHATLPADEWDELRGWHGGLFARLFDALEVFAEVK
ncbi:hypothetical protein B0T19DRAFT_446874 [Cercophora scortea]|uniref:GST N-terminal domain-containing protein n=1 Tax=Cercophora scortea TaxID=314031 RepID=A0AAE0M2Q7_9PEZI|nr:hypothetical protein B0T19DRAFT_446874 [Cercophora scortea]